MSDIKLKAQKELPDFVSGVDGAQREELEAKLVALAKESEEVIDAKEADEGLQKARESAKELAAPYRDAQNVLRLKTRYILAVLKDRGQA